MKRSKKPLTFVALLASAVGLTGCIPPAEDPEVDVYGPPPTEVTESSKPEYTDPPLILDGEVAIDDTYYDENGNEATEPTNSSFGPHDNEVSVYGPPRDRGNKYD